MPEEASPERTPHRVVWQLADGGGDLHERFLRSLANLLADLQAQGVQVEVVAHGAGLDLVLPGNGSANGVHDLQSRGVTFLACENTLRSRQLTVGELCAGVRSVPSGVGHLVRRQAQGWSYLRA